MGGWGPGSRPVPTGLSPEGKAHREHREKLELVASFSFFGNIMSMASVQLAGAKRDALLLSFKDAKVGSGLAGGEWVQKARWEVLVHSGGFGGSAGRADGQDTVLTCHPQLSVVEYDPGTHDLKTLSLHYFEEPELRVGPCPTPSAQPIALFPWDLLSLGLPDAPLSPGRVRAERAHTEGAGGP